MEYQAGDSLEVEYERAYVVYDATTGAIVHEHRTTTFSGAEGRSEDEDQERAVELARRMGHREADLQALPVPADFELQACDQVDVKARRLVSDGAPPRSAD
jgi:hypothetical protein